MGNRRPFSGVGICSLLVIFAVLCMSVFALLSVSTVQSQARLAEKARAAADNYYRAENEAEQILAQLRSGEIPPGVESPGKHLYTYSCDLSETQTLAVWVAVTGSEYEILRWQVVSTVEWQADDRIPVWRGE